MDLLTPPLSFDYKEKPAPSQPAKRRSSNRQLENGGMISRRSSHDLLQNCDLPPPLKGFSPILQENRTAAAAAARPCRPTISPPPSPPPSAKVNDCDVDPGWNHHHHHRNHGGDGLSLLRALRLSQTRAREAERKASLASLQNQQMATLLLEESLRLYAHRHWVKLLEIEISKLRDRHAFTEDKVPDDDDDDGQYNAATWCLALALCLGIAGVGFLLGRCLP